MTRKILILILSLGTTLQASELKKVLDGGVAKCDEVADVGSRAFRLKILTETQTLTTRNIDMNLDLLKCAQSSLGFELVPTTADEVIVEKVLSRGQYINVNSTLVALNISALDQDGKLLAVGRISEPATGKYLLSFKGIDINVPEVVISSMFVQDFEQDGTGQVHQIESQGGTYLLTFK